MLPGQGYQTPLEAVINVYEAMVEGLAGQKLTKLREKPAPVPIRPPLISNEAPRTEPKATR